VSFTYDGHPVLRGIDFDIPAGKITAVVGASGSGKSTILRLIPLLDRPSIGSILIDGQPLDRVSVGSLRAQVAFVPQRGSIFSGTVRENLSLARPSAPQEELVSACRKVHAMEFIERLADGFDTVLGKGGTTLSAGQEKRLAIARALLGKPRVLVLDEPEAALDRSSLFFLLAALKQLTPGVTVVLATAHPDFARAADKIVIVDGGRITQSGDYDSLAKTSPRFRQLFGTFDEPFEPLETSTPDSIIAPRFLTKTPLSHGNHLAS
ncbi:MAG: ATP-binding cassette domain-containing protein, partial [Luteolibacter sp.]